jgi:hypothetical protein
VTTAKTKPQVVMLRRPMWSESQPKNRAHRQRYHQDKMDGDVVELQYRRHVDQRIELTGVPDDVLGAVAPNRAIAIRLQLRLLVWVSLIGLVEALPPP